MSTVVGVLIGLQVLKAEGILIGIGAVLAIGLGCGLLIRLWKWRVGVSRDSSDY